MKCDLIWWNWCYKRLISLPKLCILLEHLPDFLNTQLIPLSTTGCFNINHHNGGLYQPQSDKLNLQPNIAVTAVFLFPDIYHQSIYPALECSTAEPANSDGPGTTGAIKSDISNGKVNSVFQMHFLEDRGSRGFRQWKWQRLATSPACGMPSWISTCSL